MVTRQQKCDIAIAHIQTELFEGSPALVLFMKQKGIKKPSQIASIPPEIVKAGKYNDANGDEKFLKDGEIMQFRVLQGYLRYRNAANDNVDLDEWPSINEDTIDNFQLKRVL